MDVLSIVIAFLLGLALASLLYFAIWHYHFTDYGGSILIDIKSGVYRFMINDNFEDWADQKYIIFKIAKSEEELKRLKDINNMDLEEKDE